MGTSNLPFLYRRRRRAYSRASLALTTMIYVQTIAATAVVLATLGGFRP